jgi:Tol biopolymer transport system component
MQPLLADGQTASALQWNASGSLMAFIVRNGLSSEIWTAEPGGAQVAAITDFQGGPFPQADIYEPFYWAPDGEKLAFDASLTPLAPLALFVANADGTGSPVQISPAGYSSERAPAWNPDSARVAYIARTSTYDFDLWVHDIVSSDAVRLTRSTFNCTSTHPTLSWNPYSWSPDGSRMAMVRELDPDGPDDGDPGKECGLFVANRDGTDVHPIAAPTGDDQTSVSEHAWIDNARIAFITLPRAFAVTGDVFVGYADDSASLKVSGRLGESSFADQLQPF